MGWFSKDPKASIGRTSSSSQWGRDQTLEFVIRLNWIHVDTWCHKCNKPLHNTLWWSYGFVLILKFELVVLYLSCCLGLFPPFLCLSLQFFCLFYFLRFIYYYFYVLFSNDESSVLYECSWVIVNSIKFHKFCFHRCLNVKCNCYTW